MTKRAQVEIAGAILAVFGIAAGSWLAAREARVRAEATQKAQDAIVATVQQSLEQDQRQITDLSKTIAQAKADAVKKVAANAKTFAAANTPQKAADLATKVMDLPLPITAGPAQIEVPLPDAPKAKAYILACEDCKASLEASAKEVAAQHNQLDLKDKQLGAKDQELAAVAKERDDWKKSAKGSGWQRFTRAVKYAVIAGAVGYVVGKKF